MLTHLSGCLIAPDYEPAGALSSAAGEPWQSLCAGGGVLAAVLTGLCFTRRGTSRTPLRPTLVAVQGLAVVLCSV